MNERQLVMNPIKQLLLEERRNSNLLVRADSNDDEEDLPVNEPIPPVQMEETTVSTANEDKPDPKKVQVEKDKTKTDHVTHNTFTTSSSSSDLIVPTTDLSRQNICRAALQPGAYEVTATHIYRVDDRPNGAMDSDIESNIGNSRIGEINEQHGRAPSLALIQAELVTARSSSFRNEPRPPAPQPIPQAAEVVEPIDPSLIKHQLMEAQMENKPRKKWIFFSLGFLVILVASLALFVFLRDNRGNSQSSSTVDNMSSTNYCTEDQIHSVCESDAVDSNDDEVMNQLFTQYRCVPASESNVCRKSGGNHDGSDERNSNVDSGGDIGGSCPKATNGSECPPDKTTDEMCKEILSQVQQWIQQGGSPVNFDYTPYCAQTIAERCNDPNTVCDVWDDIFDDSEDRR